ncbi:hypothetical protein Afil01_28170 [Actinorhabdospora filicis]|uniref:Lipoprotein LprG n=1 Tax=Actinorhabdospora filicis TaxID=1785913 RepID=A0A9W6SJ42_9ACTN|nr:hypothetical protein [Actinorhabdospora filicis]GLZ78010.1 hypothetical protein Afil01_28170 [Actinorhabdospora filicis]
MKRFRTPLLVLALLTALTACETGAAPGPATSSSAPAVADAPAAGRLLAATTGRMTAVYRDAEGELLRVSGAFDTGAKVWRATAGPVNAKRITILTIGEKQWSQGMTDMWMASSVPFLPRMAPWSVAEDLTAATATIDVSLEESARLFETTVSEPFFGVDADFAAVPYTLTLDGQGRPATLEYAVAGIAVTITFADYGLAVAEKAPENALPPFEPGDGTTFTHKCVLKAEGLDCDLPK